MTRARARALRLIVSNRRPRADAFPPDTPEPAAEPYDSLDRLLSHARLWLCALAAAAHLGLLLFLLFN